MNRRPSKKAVFCCFARGVRAAVRSSGRRREHPRKLERDLRPGCGVKGLSGMAGVVAGNDQPNSWYRIAPVGKEIATSMTRTQFVRTLEETLALPPGRLQPADTRESVPGWSSLIDVTILTILFSEFGLEAEEELLEYRSVGELLAILDGHRVFADS